MIPRTFFAPRVTHRECSALKHSLFRIETLYLDRVNNNDLIINTLLIWLSNWMKECKFNGYAQELFKDRNQESSQE
jgi:hypothetical protein